MNKLKNPLNVYDNINSYLIQFNISFGVKAIYQKIDIDGVLLMNAYSNNPINFHMFLSYFIPLMHISYNDMAYFQNSLDRYKVYHSMG